MTKFATRIARGLHWRATRLVRGHLYGALVHPIRERLHRRPDPSYSRELGRTTSPAMAKRVEELRRDGIVTLSEYVAGDRLRAVQQSFQEVYEALRQAPEAPSHPFVPAHLGSYKEYAYRSQETNTTYTYHPFQYSLPLLEIALDDVILALVERYFGKPVMLSEAGSSRYYPMPPRDFSSWMWHHDALGKRINVMVLLTDVTPRDQYMSYLKGSHRVVHRYPHFGGTSRVSEAELRRLPAFERMDCVAAAGTVFVFDSNGVHRGNRSDGAHRDSLISCYCCGAQITKLPIRREFWNALTTTRQEFLRRNVRLELVD